MQGDGAHTAPPVLGLPSSPGLTPEQLIEAWSLLAPLVAETLRKQVELAVKQEMRPVLASPAWFQQQFDISESSFYRIINKLSIPARSVHGQIWTTGDGPKRYSVAEWEQKKKLHTRTISNDIKRRTN